MDVTRITGMRVSMPLSLSEPPGFAMRRATFQASASTGVSGAYSNTAPAGAVKAASRQPAPLERRQVLCHCGEPHQVGECHGELPLTERGGIALLDLHSRLRARADGEMPAQHDLEERGARRHGQTDDSRESQRHLELADPRLDESRGEPATKEFHG